MFSGSIITNSSSIIKFLKESRFELYFTKPQLHIIALIMSAMIKKGFVGKVTDVADLMPLRHRTNVGKFLSKSPWNEDYVERTLRNLVIKKIKSKIQMAIELINSLPAPINDVLD